MQEALNFLLASFSFSFMLAEVQNHNSTTAESLVKNLQYYHCESEIRVHALNQLKDPSSYAGYISSTGATSHGGRVADTRRELKGWRQCP